MYDAAPIDPQDSARVFLPYSPSFYARSFPDSAALSQSSHGSLLSVPGSSAFHSTPSRRGAPLIPLIVLLKTSAAMEVVRTAGRIVLTIMPVILIKNHKTRRHLKHAALHGIPLSEEKTNTLLKRLRNRTLLIAAQLAGPGWYQAMGPRSFIPPSDWRYGWVRDTLRELERTIPDDIPLPPPADHPLRPRPRASEYLRMFTESMCKRHVAPVPHSIPGPPYSLLVVDKPDASNAFSYGFGPDGGGGIVVYSGFWTKFWQRAPQRLGCRVWWAVSSAQSRLLRHIRCQTPEQTAELAILLSHELAHLVLSHHLETLSSATIIIPGVMSMVSDIIRVVIFPVTMLFGPFVNDAVAQLGKKVGEYCTSVKQEIEADVGYDARKAVTFLGKSLLPPTARRGNARRVRHPRSSSYTTITGSKHPVSEVRVNSLKGELLRWETERRAQLRRQEVPREDSHVVLATA
ncbi:hypothetical protein B0H14DRAFT_3079647 [Mycena olivaceomarginata]|nr:hypothetical protein B0H14DRAFT_3079647 [Mycena olivaceomarginata]